MYSDKYLEEISTLKADKISGSEEIVRRAVQTVKEEIILHPEIYSNVNDLFEMLLPISKIKKEMAALKNVLIYFVDFFQEGIPIKELADRVMQKLDDQKEAIIQKLFPYLTKAKVIMTFSRSSTIADALRKLAETKEKDDLPEIILFESRPALEGKKLALELSTFSYQIKYFVDAAMGLAVKTTKPDLILIGADTIFPNGNVANKIGCHALALFAYQYNIPFYIVSSTLKLLLKATPFSIQSYKPDEVWSKGKPENVKIFNPYFEIIPANLISGYFTEYGFSSNIPDVKMVIEKSYIHKMYE
ncbi:MAG: hypothetical protein ACTSX6_08840 [Candidatus Heimdallarchaeaceae archaeon]